MTKGGALEGLIAASRRHAQRRSQRNSTAHCVLAMMQSDPDANRVLLATGVREAEWISALRLCDDEPDLVMERAADRAQKLAQRTDRSGAPIVRPLHLLVAITAEPRSSAVHCLERLGIGAGRVQSACLDALSPDAPLDVVRPSEPPPPRFAAPRARTHAPAAQASLAFPATHAGASSASPPSAPTTTPSSAAPTSAEPRSATIPPPPTNRRVRPTNHRATTTRAAKATGTPSAKSAATKQAPAKPATESDPGELVSNELAPFELDRERYPILRALGRNLTELAARGALDPVLGRERELEQLFDVLGRRRGNSALLVGPPGVGKTALVEGLAQEIALGAKQVPALEGRIVVELSAGALASGTGVRGALAEKLRKLKDEVARADGKVLLFLDEIHAIVGEPAGADDIASELKGALARGELTCIGATTEAEHRKHFERDPAFARRFTQVFVGEPSPDASKRILAGVIARYATHHAVRYDPAAVDASVELSVRFLPERSLPDKALAVLDLAGARARRLGLAEVGVAEIARVIADEALVPLERLLFRDGERLLALESKLAARVVGQRAPLARIAETLRKGAAGFRGKRPLGTFLLLGTTGVGKTETAKAIADLLFAPGAMTRFDMSELSEAHAVARLLGAPPGYVGHDTGGQLTEAVRKRPYQLILLDEIEKAHPDVLLALLPLLDEGRLTDGRGRTVDFTNTVIVMTSNLGASALMQRAPRSIGFSTPSAASDAAALERDERATRVLDAARKALPPELWNRIDEPLFFAPLEEADALEIGRRMLQGVGRTLYEERGIVLELDESACEALVRAGGFDPALGARPMRRVVGRLVESPLATRVLAGTLERGMRVRVRGVGSEIRFEVVRSAASQLAELSAE